MLSNIKNQLLKLLKKLSGGQIAFLGFALIALMGMLLLMLPICNNYNVWTNPIDALFTSVSAVCVTGLIVVPTGTYWNLLGQTIIIVLIETGGLGFMTLMTMFFVAVGRRITIHDRLLIQSSINSDHITGIVSFVKKIFYYAFAIELIGAILLAFTFIPEFGFIKGIYFALWHSISMYCNAGFDLMASVGGSSFENYVNNSYVNLIIIALIIIGGLGFSVYVDILDYPKRKRFSLHTKAVFIMTGLLLLIGAILFFCFEFNNPLTLGNLPWYGKINAAFFQSTTPRTAGANTINQAHMTDASIALTNLLMFIGASPGSTGGGIKTTTVFVVLVTIWSVLMGRRHVNTMRRRIEKSVIRRALSIFIIGLVVIFIIYILLLCLEPNMNSDFLLYEVLSAYGTVGLSCGITADLSIFSKMLLIICMFVGRVGPLTIAYVITNTEKRLHENRGQFKLPTGNIIIG